MKRILGMVVAIAALLAYSPAATAASVTFNLTGTTGTWSRSTDAQAAVSGPPQNGGLCPPGMASPVPLPTGNGNCFRYAFEPGSSVSVDITGNAVTMLGGTINIHEITPLVFGTIVLETIATTTIYGATAFTPAATGTLVGNNILWSTYANVSTVGTINCTGPNCALISHPGFPIPIYPYLNAIANTTNVTALVLGQWNLDSGLYPTSITGSTNAIAAWSNVAEDPNRRVRAYTFGATHLGNPVPEPASAALVLLGLGALALRSRKA